MAGDPPSAASSQQIDDNHKDRDPRAPFAPRVAECSVSAGAATQTLLSVRHSLADHTNSVGEPSRIDVQPHHSV